MPMPTNDEYKLVNRTQDAVIAGLVEATCNALWERD